MREGMHLLLERSLAGGLLILAVILLRRLFRGRVPRQTWPLLWGVCLFRLLSPVAIRSPLSLYALFQAAPASPVPGRPVLLTGLPLSRSVTPGEVLLPCLWALVSMALALWFFTDWVRLRRQVSALPLAEEGDARQTALPPGAALRLGYLPQAPLTFGILRPTVVLPPDLSGQALEHVLAHEAAHIRRGDNLWSLALLPALCLHWYNPAVWLMALFLKRDLELCCDAAVLRRLDGEGRTAYANTLINMAGGGGTGSLWCAGFGLRPAEERIRNIMTFKRSGAVSLLLALTLVAGTTTALATTPVESDEAAAEKAASFSVKAEGELTPGDGALSQFVITTVGELDFPSTMPEMVPYTYEEYAAECESVKAYLAQQVADGAVTQADADEILAGQELTLARMKEGSILLLHGKVAAEDGSMIALMSIVEAATAQ